METQQLKQEDTQTREGVSHRVLSWFPCFSCLPSSLERLKEPKNQEEEQVNDNEDLSLGRNKASGHGHGQANQRETRITRQHHEDEKEIQKENTHRKSISSRKSVSNETIKTEVVYRFTVCPAIELCSTFYTFSMSSLKIHRHSRQKVRESNQMRDVFFSLALLVKESQKDSSCKNEKQEWEARRREWMRITNERTD